MREKYFNSLEEFLTHINNAEVPEWAHSNDASRVEFFGHLTYGEAFEKAQKGCPETAAKMKEMYSRLHATSAKVLKPQIIFADSGLFFDTATFLEGTPEYWLSEEITEVEGRGSRGVVKIYANIAAACFVTEDDFMKRGANMVQAVEMLEISGYSTEIILCDGLASSSSSSSGSTGVYTYITIKQPDQMLDFDKLAFVLGHVSFFRRLMLRYFESFSEAERTLLTITASGGYGYPREVPAEKGIYLTRSSYSMTQDEWRKILSEYVTFEEKI
jgi:hypothetical protein